MTAADLLPPIPAPPHDPRTLRLNAAVGWRAQLSDAVSCDVDRSLMLGLTAGSKPSTGSPDGTFGGAVLPKNIATHEAGGTIFRLSNTQLERFNPCGCAFEPVACFGGRGALSRQLDGAEAIGIQGNDLYVCDTGNARLQVFALPSMVLKAVWSVPGSAALPNPAAPSAIAFDSKGVVYVGDRSNLGVHRFSRSGKWLSFIGALGVVEAVAVDCEDNLYVAVAGSDQALVIGADGSRHVERSAAAVANAFCAVEVPEGVLPETPAPVFAKHGTFITAALDSRIYQCQWHRVILCGRLPRGCRVVVSTFTSEIDLPSDTIVDPALRWATQQQAREFTEGQFECLVSSKGGRYLWLRLELRGDGQRSPQICEVEVKFPRISLRRYLPAVFAEEPSGADFTDRFLSIFDTTFRSIEQHVDDQAHLFDPMSTPAEPEGKARIDFLTWLARWIGISLDRHWPEQKRRAWVRNAGSLFHMRGTREGLRHQLLLLLGMPAEAPPPSPRTTSGTRCGPVNVNCRKSEPDCHPWQPPPLILEHFQLRRWLFLGTGRIGEEAALWGQSIAQRSQLGSTAQTEVTRLHRTPDPFRDPFLVYAHKFTVFVPACFGRSESTRRSLLNLLESERPAHTLHHIEYVEPRFRIGVQSTVGFNSVVGKLPPGLPLGQSKLGASSKLQASDGPRPVRHARVGSSTKLV